MKKTILALVCVSGLMGCGDGGGSTMSGAGGSSSMSQTARDVTCRAALSRSSYTYTLTGNTAELTQAGAPAPLVLTLVQKEPLGKRALYGIWQIPVTSNTASDLLGLKLDATLTFADGYVIAQSVCGANNQPDGTMASVSSRATITDNTIDILETKEDVKTFTVR